MAGEISICKYRMNVRGDAYVPEYWCRKYGWTCLTICQSGKPRRCKFFVPAGSVTHPAAVHQKRSVTVSKSVQHYYSRTAVAEYLGVSRMTLARWEKMKPIEADQYPTLGSHIHTTNTKVLGWLHKLIDLESLRSTKQRRIIIRLEQRMMKE